MPDVPSPSNAGDMPEQERHDPDEVLVGDWFWLKDEETINYKKTGRIVEVLVCATHIGSNYVEVQSPHGSHWRVHEKEFWKECRRERMWQGVINKEQAKAKEAVETTLQEIQALTRRVGMAPTAESDPGSSALVVLNGQANLKLYKQELIEAKKNGLPTLFKQFEEQTQELTTWLKASSLVIRAQVSELKEHVGKIDDRLFSVSLYAGLVEEVAKIQEGYPATAADKLHLMQGTCYMDEECLASYQLGGIEFRTIEAFDAWLLKPENLDRLLPFPRTITAFRVRRNDKERECESISEALINISLEALDKSTFLYMRNGQQVYRLGTDVAFDDKIFPDQDAFNPSEPMRGTHDGGQLIPEREFLALAEKERDRERQYKAWEKAEKLKPKSERKHEFDNPYRNSITGPGHTYLSQYVPFNSDTVYYDDIRDAIADRIKHYNRIALIVQGLFDRSTVFHPHVQAKLWTPGGFEALIHLVYDRDRALYAGAEPDIQAYFEAGRKLITIGSVTIGQDDFWARHEAKKHNNKWTNYRRDKLTYHRPCGNPGPGDLAVVKARRGDGFVFSWTRERQWSPATRWGSKRAGDPMPCSVTVPRSKLFNVSAYKPGDYKQFFADPRTRAKYMQWGNLLLAAEEYHAGNLDMQDGKLKKRREDVSEA